MQWVRARGLARLVSTPDAFSKKNRLLLFDLHSFIMALTRTRPDTQAGKHGAKGLQGTKLFDSLDECRCACKKLPSAPYWAQTFDDSLGSPAFQTTWYNESQVGKEDVMVRRGTPGSWTWGLPQPGEPQNSTCKRWKPAWADSVQCRIYHLWMAYTMPDAAAVHCPHGAVEAANMDGITAPDGGCVVPDSAGPASLVPMPSYCAV